MISDRLSVRTPSKVWGDEVYAAIRESILDGRYPPGSRLVESRLATEYGVSRTRIRDSLARLEVELLVAPFAGRGLVVRSLSTQDVEEVYAMRLLLEGEAARRAAFSITHDELRKLELTNARMIEIEREGIGAVGESRRELVAAVAELNNEFHELIHTASRNSRLREIVRTVVDVPLVFRSFFWYSDAEMAESAEDHGRIMEALRAGDPERAEATIRAHITRGLNTLRRDLFAEGPFRSPEG